MESLVINGGVSLNGEVEISGAKNSAVAILPASILASEGNCIINNVPNIEDVHCLERILEGLGCTVNKIKNNTLNINSSDITNFSAVSEDVNKMRASYYFIGALLARFKRAKVKMPGGCYIGNRPIDQHIRGFKALGAKVTIDNGCINIEANKLYGTDIFFDVISVGATINVMIAATMAEGVTVLKNVAKEPHVVDVANFLNKMGANIIGAGTDIIKIKGVERLIGCNYSIIPDQIEAGTFMIAAAATKGDVTVKNVIPRHLDPISLKLKEMGVLIKYNEDSIRVICDKDLKAANIITDTYPGFPTDIQQPITSLLCIAEGKSLVIERIWESRYGHVSELIKMGAKIRVEDRVAVIDGINHLNGAKVLATDLRAGAALIIAALSANGESRIEGVEHIDRGYPNIERKFRLLGAHIRREILN